MECICYPYFATCQLCLNFSNNLLSHVDAFVSAHGSHRLCKHSGPQIK
jgi:hypothetical protein